MKTAFKMNVIILSYLDRRHKIYLPFYHGKGFKRFSGMIFKACVIIFNRKRLKF